MLKQKIIHLASRLSLKFNELSCASNWDLSDIYVVSYPKSGTTWACLIIANLLAQLSQGPASAANRRIDLFNVHDYVPDIHANPSHIGRLSTAQRFIKSHENFQQWNSRISIKGQATLYPRVIYILRDGRDAMFSYYSYLKALGQVSISLEEFLADEKSSRGGWHQHVNSWLIQNTTLDARSILLVRYEDLILDAGTQLKRILEFSGLSANEGICRACIENSRSSHMRTLEEKYGDGVRYTDANYKFAGNGDRKRDRQASGALLEEYRQRHSKLFEHLGYETRLVEKTQLKSVANSD